MFRNQRKGAALSGQSPMVGKTPGLKLEPLGKCRRASRGLGIVEIDFAAGVAQERFAMMT